MQTYVILRRNFWNNAEALEISASISARVGAEEMPDQVKWIRSYVVREEDENGTEKLGTVCIYRGTSAEAVREHARRVGMPADEVIPVSNLVVVNDDTEL
ncbi:MAG: DUF4242 domain-containing protein [Acidobacteria bacterium]|nr:DUF4242 domain-containing protein [Acidobacteriota bacterium]